MPNRNRRTLFFDSQHRGTCAAVALLIVIISIFCLSYLAFGSRTEESPKTLVLANVLFRHGDRTPTDFYPNDPYQDASYWPEGFGALTNKGKVEAFSLGEFLRMRYGKFLPDFYSPDDLYIVSSDHDRCLMSASLCLAGLYPPKGSQIWNEQLLWQPIPVHTSPRHLDELIVVKKPCPRYESELAHIKNETVSSDEDIETFDFVSLHSGKSVKDILAAEFLYNTLEIQVRLFDKYNVIALDLARQFYHMIFLPDCLWFTPEPFPPLKEKRGLKLPGWTSSVFPQPLKEMACRSLALFTATDGMKRFKGGPLLKDIVNHMLDKVSRRLEPNRRLFLYSAHDITIVSFLRTLGITDVLKPDPAAAVIIELHKAENGGHHHVQIFYKNSSSTQQLHPLFLTECPPPCNLKDFIETTKPFMPADWSKECEI